jgi:hypothetical protein
MQWGQERMSELAQALNAGAVHACVLQAHQQARAHGMALMALAAGAQVVQAPAAQQPAPGALALAQQQRHGSSRRQRSQRSG